MCPPKVPTGFSISLEKDGRIRLISGADNYRIAIYLTPEEARAIGVNLMLRAQAVFFKKEDRE